MFQRILYGGLQNLSQIQTAKYEVEANFKTFSGMGYSVQE